MNEQDPIFLKQYQGINPEDARQELINKYEGVVRDLKVNSDYYDSVRRPEAIGWSTPVAMQALLAHVGYPRLYLNSLSDRLEVEGFRTPGSDEPEEQFMDWWQANNLDVESSLGHTEAMVHGRAYITVSAPDPGTDPGIEDGVPIIRVESPTSLYADIDPRTQQVYQAIRATYNDDGSEIIAVTLYLLDQTVYYVNQEGGWQQTGAVSHGLQMVPVVPLANRTRLSDLYGTSEITPELRSITDAAARTLMNMQATSELMAVPQRLIFGADPKELGIDPDTGARNWNAYIANILAFGDSDTKATQFNAAELRNFAEAIDALDKKAAAYTGLPPQYLSYGSDNPASAEAIRASESRLVKTAERKCRVFGAAWEQAMRVATKVMGSEIPPDMYRLECVWRDPSTPTYAAKADAASKLYNQGLGVIPKEQARIDMGYSETQRSMMKQWDETENPIGALLGGASGVGPTGAPSAPTNAQQQRPSGDSDASS